MDRNYEQEAQKQGWKPKEDFVNGGGNEADWVDAKVFVERGENSAPILKSRLEKLERQFENSKRTQESLAKHHNRMLQKEEQRRQELIAQLEDARANAVANGDAQAFKKADRQLNEMRAEKIEPIVQPVPQTEQAEVEEWLAENPWYNEDYALQAMADGYSDKLSKMKPNLKGRAFLDEVSKFVKENLPEKKKPARSEPPVVDDEDDKAPPPKARNSGGSRKKGFDDLPKADRRECERLIKEIPGFTKEQFLEYYDWE